MAVNVAFESLSSNNFAQISNTVSSLNAHVDLDEVDSAKALQHHL